MFSVPVLALVIVFYSRALAVVCGGSARDLAGGVGVYNSKILSSLCVIVGPWALCACLAQFFSDVSSEEASDWFAWGFFQNKFLLRVLFSCLRRFPVLWLTLEAVGVVVIVIFSLASDILPGAIRVDFCYPCVTPVVTRCHNIVHLAGVVTPTQHGSAVGTFSMRYKVIHTRC